MTIPNELMQLFSPALKPSVHENLSVRTCLPEEIRCRIGFPVSVIEAHKVRQLTTPNVSERDLDYLLERATSASVHTFASQMQNGYLFTSSGYRVGLCGTLYSADGNRSGIRGLTSVCIRIPRAVFGCADQVFSKLTQQGFQSTLILSPPGVGKTTVLRELIRKLSASGLRVSVADERCEIAAVHGRIRSFDLGPNTDVMSGGRKGESAMMLLRSMNPQVLAFDEITEKEDLVAIAHAAGCGAALLATAHAADWETLERRRLYRETLSLGIFEYLVWIRMECSGRTYQVERVSM